MPAHVRRAEADRRGPNVSRLHCDRPARRRIVGMPSRRDVASASSVSASAAALVEPRLAAGQPSAFTGGQAGEAREIEGVRLRWCPPGRFVIGQPGERAGPPFRARRRSRSRSKRVLGGEASEATQGRVASRRRRRSRPAADRDASGSATTFPMSGSAFSRPRPALAERLTEPGAGAFAAARCPAHVGVHAADRGASGSTPAAPARPRRPRSATRSRPGRRSSTARTDAL